MTGNRLKYPQIKAVMRHILSFYDEISCSVTESAQSSPEHPSTVQQTIKRTDMKAITVSTKKKCRRGDKSQDQTTSKKTTTGGVVNIHKDVKDAANTNNVVTPARTSMPRNKLTSIVKSSQEKTSQPNAVKKQVANFNHNLSQIGKSTTKKDLNSSTKGEDGAKLTEERAESQPAKKTNVLTKQDSSKYLRGGST